MSLWWFSLEFEVWWHAVGWQLLISMFCLSLIPLEPTNFNTLEIIFFSSLVCCSKFILEVFHVVDLTFHQPKVNQFEVSMRQFLCFVFDLIRLLLFISSLNQRHSINRNKLIQCKRKGKRNAFFYVVVVVVKDNYYFPLKHKHFGVYWIFHSYRLDRVAAPHCAKT